MDVRFCWHKKYLKKKEIFDYILAFEYLQDLKFPSGMKIGWSQVLFWLSYMKTEKYDLNWDMATSLINTLIFIGDLCLLQTVILNSITRLFVDY
jgi:hypothetical protein